MSKTFKSIEDVRAFFKGKGASGPESETIVIDNGMDKSEGHVTVWGNTSAVAKTIDRCGKYVVSFSGTEDGVYLVIDRKAFRGVEYIFKKIGKDNEQKSEKASERMKKYWEDKREKEEIT